MSPTTAFVRDIAAERRWVMSGTPTTGTSSSIALDQIQRLLTFLRHPEYGLNEGKARWERLIAKPFLAQSADAKELLEYVKSCKGCAIEFRWLYLCDNYSCHISY